VCWWAAGVPGTGLGSTCPGFDLRGHQRDGVEAECSCYCMSIGDGLLVERSHGAGGAAGAFTADGAEVSAVLPGCYLLSGPVAVVGSGAAAACGQARFCVGGEAEGWRYDRKAESQKQHEAENALQDNSVAVGGPPLPLGVPGAKPS
jgi:hypothetical protein